MVSTQTGESPWSKTHGGEDPSKKLIPFGCGVWFKPAPTKYVPSKWEPRGQWGIFAGYRFAPGCEWRGDYYVWDLDQFMGVDFSVDSSGRAQPNMVPHITRVVKLPTEGERFVFPLRHRYRIANLTLGGRVAGYERAEGEDPEGGADDPGGGGPPPPPDGDGGVGPRPSGGEPARVPRPPPGGTGDGGEGRDGANPIEPAPREPGGSRSLPPGVFEYEGQLYKMSRSGRMLSCDETGAAKTGRRGLVPIT